MTTPTTTRTGGHQIPDASLTTLAEKWLTYADELDPGSRRSAREGDATAARAEALRLCAREMLTALDTPERKPYRSITRDVDPFALCRDGAQ